MRVIAVCNQKGGVAKTTTTVNLAAFLARDHGQRILVIDADGQCNTTALFEPDAGLPRDTLADLLRMPQNERTEFSVSFWLGTCIVPSSFPGVELTEELCGKLMADVQSGMSLSNAYRKQEAAKKDAEIAELKRQLEAEKQNNKNRSNSPGSQKDSGGRRMTSDHDKFEQALFG